MRDLGFGLALVKQAGVLGVGLVALERAGTGIANDRR
jgi:hypothetical protein